MEAKRALAVGAVLLLALPVVPAASGVDHVLISAVYYDTHVSGEGDEAVRLANPTSAALSLAGWKLTDGEGTLTFPAGATLGAGQSLWVAGKASDFRLDMVVSPQWEHKADTDAAVPQLASAGTFTLANSADEVRLLDAGGNVVDAVAYGTSPGGAGWSGPPLADVPEGVLLERDLDELTLQFPDTDTAADWDDARIYRAGQSHFPLASFEATGATLFSSPDSTFGALTGFLASAQTSLDVELYELTNPHLGDALAARALAGVHVRVLLEGGPVGFEQAERYQQNSILASLVAAGAEVRFMVTNASQGVHDRYAFQHGKFAVSDGTRVLAMSGNWKLTGAPVDPTYGNREWGIVVDSAGLAGYVGEVFADDWDAVRRDVLPFGQGTDWRYLPPPPDFVPDRTVPQGPYAPYFPARTIEEPFTVTAVLSPDTSLLEHGGLRKLLREARDEVLVEQMYAHQHWGPAASGSPATHPSLYLEEIIEAARQGASVYVLLGDEFIDDEDTRNNRDTVDYLRGIAGAEDLDLFAKVVNSSVAELTKIHNKGVVVDRGTAVISSINWGRGSAQDNRELALLAAHPAIADFFRDIFWYDWNPRANKPVTDLTVTGIAVAREPLAILPGVAEVGHPLRDVLEVTIANTGAYGAGDFDVTVTAEPLLLGPQAFTARVNNLPSGAAQTLRIPWEDSLHLGRFRLTAVIDAAGEVKENDEGNNVLAGDFVVEADAPGLLVPLPAMSASPP